MSEETIDTGSTADSGDSSSQSIDSGSSSQSSDVNLQDRMAGAEDYWYSDGIDGFYGPDGQPVLKADGSYVKTQTELDAMLGNQTPIAKTPEQSKQTSQGSKQSADTVFDTNGNYDPVKGSAFLKEIDKPYISSVVQVQPKPAQDQLPPGAQQQKAEQTRSLSEQVLEYETVLRSNLLDPLIEARDDMIEAGRWNNENPRAVNFDKLIKERSASIDGLVKEKQLKLWEESFSSKGNEEAEKKASAELQEAVNKSIFTVSKNYNGEEQFQKLMIGSNDAKGQFVPGPGRDLVLAIVDLFSDGGQVTDATKAVTDGWNKIAKNPEILSTIAKYVSGYHVARNLARNNAAVRKSTIAEEKTRQTMRGKPPQSVTPSQQGGNGMPKELAGWLGMSTV